MIGEFGTEVGNALTPPEQFFSSKATISCRCDCPITPAPPPPPPRPAPAHLEFPVLLAVSHTFSFCKFSPIVSPRHPMRARPASIRGLHGSAPNLVRPRLPTPPLAIISLVLGYLCDTRQGGITENASDGVPGDLMPLVSPDQVTVWTIIHGCSQGQLAVGTCGPGSMGGAQELAAVPQFRSLPAHTT